MMKRKTKSPPAAGCNSVAVSGCSAAIHYRRPADDCPVILDTYAAAPTVEYAAAMFSPLMTHHEAAFRCLVAYKWRTGLYRASDDCEGILMGTTAILYPRESNECEARQIQRHNYDNFINTMAEIIQKYAPQIQQLREGLS